MHMYGIIVGNLLLAMLITGCCCGFCCNCFCRGPLYRRSVEGLSQLKAKRRRVTAEKRATQNHKGSPTAAGDAGRIVHVVDATAGAKAAPLISAERSAELEQRFGGLLQPVQESSKDELEPIIDFVENKSQIGWLTPCIFIFAFAMGSAIVMCGSALIGPENTLGTVPKAPTRIAALCRSPVHELLVDVMAPKLGAKHAYVGAHLAWTALLDPTTDICADTIAQ